MFHPTPWTIQSRIHPTSKLVKGRGHAGGSGLERWRAHLWAWCEGGRSDAELARVARALGARIAVAVGVHGRRVRLCSVPARTKRRSPLVMIGKHRPVPSSKRLLLGSLNACGRRDSSEQRRRSWRHSPHAVLVPVIASASAVTAAISGGGAGSIIPPASNRVVHRHTTNLDLLPDAVRLCQPRHRQRVCRGVVLVEVGAEICRQAATLMSESDRKRKTTTHSRDKQRGTVRSSGVGTRHITIGLALR